MNIFRSMMSVNFKVNEKGETIFFYPVFLGRRMVPAQGIQDHIR